MLYFAYGSNMDWKQMRERCPSARFVCIAILPDHTVAFTRKSDKRDCGVADVIPMEHHEVWGVVYQTDETDVGRLDRSENYSPARKRNGYVREERHVFADGHRSEPLLTAIYIAVKEVNPPLPNAEYKEQLLTGARFWHLPDNYVLELEEVETTT